LLPPGTVLPDRHPLILDGLAVTFYLVFKEPTVRVHRSLASQPSNGEPFKLIEAAYSVSSLISTYADIFGLPREDRLRLLATRHDIVPEAQIPWDGRLPATLPLRHQLPLVEPGGLSGGKVGMRAGLVDWLAAVQPPRAPVTLRRA
jgi:hypothetical protein